MASAAPLVVSGMLAFMLAMTFQNTIVDAWTARALNPQRSAAFLAHSLVCGFVGIVLAIGWSA